MDDGRNWIRKRVERQSAQATRDTGSTSTSEEAAADAPAETASEESRLNGTFIDQGAEFEGTLRLSDSFRIDTEFRGEIVSAGRVLVAESAGIQANIRAREVVIAGAVVGNVTAGRQVIIRANGRLHGDIETPCLELEKGAFFNGRTKMARPEAGLRAEAQASAQPEPKSDSSSRSRATSSAGSTSSSAPS